MTKAKGRAYKSRHKKLYVKDSSIEGMGLFARRDIKKGEAVFIMKGHLITRHLDPQEYVNAVGIKKDIWIYPAYPFEYINHSCNPNLGMKGTVTFVALRDIKKDEELTFDYSISEDSEWSMQCFCPEDSCRNVIRGIKYLPEPVFNRYLPYIPRYFQKVYWRYNGTRG